MLDVADFGRNPHAREFGEYGVCYVRHGKAKKGSAAQAPQRADRLAVDRDVLDEWVSTRSGRCSPASDPSRHRRPVALRTGPAGRLPRGSTTASPPTATALGLAAGLDFHSLRRSYVTHLIEDGWDALFVQEQVGHEHASTTSIYTCVSSDFRTRTLRRAPGRHHHRRRARADPANARRPTRRDHDEHSTARRSATSGGCGR